MPDILHASFLRALGYAIANSLWQTAICWLLYILINAPGKLSSPGKYLLAVLLQMIGFCWFLLTFRFYYFQPISPVVSPGIIADAQNFGIKSISQQLLNWLGKVETILPFLSLAYLLFIAYFFCKWMIGYHQTQIIRTRGLQEMSAHWRLFVKKIAEKLSIQKGILIFISDQVTTPLTIGFLKPVILIPLASINHLTTAQLEAVILHEVAHIKRADYLTNLLLSIVEFILFFNPFSRLLSHIIHNERENSCDDWVLQFSYNAADYATALLRIARIQSPTNLAMAAGGKRNELLQRVKRMIGEKDTPFNYPKRVLAFMLVTGLLIVLAWIYPAPSVIQAKKISTSLIATKASMPAAPQPPAIKEDKIFDPVFLLPEKIKQQIAEAKTATIFEHPQVPEKIDKLLPDNLPQIINDALQQASTEWKEFANAENNKEEKNIRLKRIMPPIAAAPIHKSVKDTLRSFTHQNRSFNQNIQFAWKKIEEEINNIPPPPANNIAQAPTPLPDEAFVRLQINKAMQEVKKMDLERMVLEALDKASISEKVLLPLLNLEKFQFTEKDKEILRKELREKQRLRFQKIQPRKPQPPGVLVSLDQSDAPQMFADANTEDQTIEINSAEEDAQLIKIKITLLKELRQLLSNKIISVNYRREKIVPKEIIILRQ